MYKERRAVAGLTLSDRVTRTDAFVAAETEPLVRVHRPTDTDGLLPALVTIHGGGFVVGSNRMDDPLLDEWCSTLGCIAVSVDYRLAPECPYPGPLEDCYTALCWTHEHASELGIDCSRIGIYGVSAGGGLAAGLALLARDRGGPALLFQMLDSPTLDDRQATSSSHWDVPIANRATVEVGWRAYLADAYGAADVEPYAAPARATELRGLPATFISVGQLDGLRDEAMQFAERLQQAGVAVELHEYPGAPHLFTNLAPDSATARRCRQEQLTFLSTLLAETS